MLPCDTMEKFFHFLANLASLSVPAPRTLDRKVSRSQTSLDTDPFAEISDSNQETGSNKETVANFCRLIRQNEIASSQRSLQISFSCQK